MSILVWLIFGGLCGWIASVIVSIKRPKELSRYILVGVCGALISSLFVVSISRDSVVMLSVQNLLLAIFGAVLLLVIYQSIKSHDKNYQQ